jgi:hypothetical protein
MKYGLFGAASGSGTLAALTELPPLNRRDT